MATRRKKAGAKKRAAPQMSSLEAEVRDLSRRIETLGAKVRKAESGARNSTMRQLKLLEDKQAQITRSLARLARQSGAATTPIVTGLQKAWREIELAARQAAKRFRETT